MSENRPSHATSSHHHRNHMKVNFEDKHDVFAMLVLLRLRKLLHKSILPLNKVSSVHDNKSGLGPLEFHSAHSA